MNPDSQQPAALEQPDMSPTPRAERAKDEKQAYLLVLSDAIRSLRDAEAIKTKASSVLANQLGVNRAFYAEVDADDWVVEGGFSKGVTPLPEGRYAAKTYGHRVMDTYRAGRRIVFCDTRTDPGFSPEERQAHCEIEIIGAVGIPLVKEGRLIAILTVHTSAPRKWTEEEIELVEETAERTWAAVERARAEASLRESESKFRVLTESLPQLVWSCLPDGRCDYLSRQWITYTGIPESEQLEFNWLDRVIHPDDRDRTRDHWMGAVAGKHPYDIAFRIKAADGTYCWFQTRGVPLHDEQGNIIKWFGTCTDIEQQKRAEAHLKRQWLMFDTALSHTPDFTYIFDLDGRFTYINNALLSLWQMPLEAAVGKNFFELSYPADLAARLQNQIQRVIETKAVVKDHTPYTGPTGETRFYEYIFVPIFGSDGNVQAVAGSTRDITDRERAERALAASELKLQQVFAQAPVAIVAFRGDNFVIELANPPYCSLMPGRDLVGRPLAEALPELTDEVWDVFRGVINTGDPFVANEWLIQYDQDADGVAEDHWFNVVYNPFREAGGKVTGVIAVLTDVTKHVTMRLALERANKDLEEFAYVASHDLREPLRMINIYGQMLAERFGQGDPKAQEFSRFIKEGIARMEELLSDLLQYSQASHREQDEKLNQVADLDTALAQAISDLTAQIDETKAVIASDPLPKAAGDTGQLRHVFQNILSNALKYRNEQTAPQIRISAQLSDGMWTISIRDNGIGFDPRYAQRIFGLFKRLHKDEYPGTGLGLAICQRIVERYGGRMWAESKLGDGATFHFSLPHRK